MEVDREEVLSDNVVSIESEFVKFSISPENGSYCFLDKQTGVAWNSNPYQERMGEVALKIDDESKRLSLRDFQANKIDNIVKLVFHHQEGDSTAEITIRIELLPDGRTAEITYEAGRGTEVEEIRLLDESLWVTDASEGYMLVPIRLGLLISADSGKTFKHKFPTFAYEGCHMEMLGMVRDGSAALVTWHDPYVTTELQSAMPDKPIDNGKQIISASLSMRKSAKSFQIRFLGEGDYVKIAQTYREVADEKGWLVTWDEKLRDYPIDEKLFGAINFKLWSALTRRIDEEGNEKGVNVNWTFKEATQVAEHLKYDLKLDKVLFIMGGWIHRGYDNQHPDILPAAPECGGNKELAECSKKIQDLGYMFCFHDNYQDIYRDSPSWDENLIMKNPDGSLKKGGLWAGGRAYLTCSREAVELAKRPQNLPAVKKLFNPNSYFIDTTYAAGLYECFDKNHPLSLWDDMIYKSEISDYARSIFGNFGSECGREWAIPHSDFFEGLTGVSGRYYHGLDIESMGGTVVPLFEMVYRDCISMYGKYGYDYSASAEYVLHHISIGRPMHYHNVPRHLYWKDIPTDEPEIPESGKPDPNCFARGYNGWTEGMCVFDRFVKNTYEILSPLNEITSKMRMTEHEFLDDNREIIRTVFENVPGGIFDPGVYVVVNKSDKRCSYKSGLGGKVILPPNGFIIECPTFVAFYALSWDGMEYENPAFFTMRSLNGASILWSSKIRVFHGFGDTRIKVKDTLHDVKREGIIN
jgi:hypothetical protein